jgi:lipopolysaccharide/colanic/teichoic acid biosynthesis glycosyltransferase
MRRYLLILLDVCLVLLSTIVALALRENFALTEDRIEASLPYFGATIIFSTVLIPAAGLYASIWRFSGLYDYVRVTCALTAISVGAVSLSFAYHRLDGVARSLPFLQVLVGTAVLVGARVLHRLSHARQQGRRKSVIRPQLATRATEMTVLVLGVTRLTEVYVNALGELAPGRVTVAGMVCLRDRHVGRLVSRYPILGMADDIESVIDKLEVHGVHVDRIVVAAAFRSLSPETKEALNRLEHRRGVSLQYLSEIVGLDGEEDACVCEVQPRCASLGELRFELAPNEIEFLSRRRFWKLKRGLDILAALTCLIVLSPFFVIIGLSVGVFMGFPVVFWQRRPGLFGKSFHLYKFRTMRSAHTADGRLLSDAERVSGFGTFLRRTRLDELPQLFNILRGDMSFVGPRPLLPKDQPKEFGARLLVRPGLTGWAQVVGGRDITPEDKAVLDVWYVRNAGLFLDLKVAARTIPIVLFGERISRSLIDRAWQELTDLGIAKAEFTPGLKNSLHLAKSDL